MTESTPDNSEREACVVKLEPISLTEMSDLVAESDNAFLAPMSDSSQTTTELLQWMKDEPGFSSLGYKADGIVISYIIGLGHKNDSTITIGPMYVSREYQRRGLGRRQVVDFIEIAKNDGYKNVYTKTWLGNKASRTIFESLGFVESGITPDDRVDGDSTIKYLLEL